MHLVEDISTYCVRQGDRQKRVVSGRCRDLELNLKNIVIGETFYVFELAGVDVILGVAWLENLGEVKVNWEKVTMIFSNPERTVTIQGDKSLKRTLVSPHNLKKEREIAVVLVLWEVGQNQGVEKKRREG